MKGRHINYSDEELAWIKLHRKCDRRKAHSEFCKIFGRDDVSLSNYNSLCKRKGWKTGRDGRFVKGQTSTMLGKTHSKEARQKLSAAAIKNNSIEKILRTKEPGDEYVDRNGYVWMRVEEPNPHKPHIDHHYVQKHRRLWEKANGAIPKNHALKCLDGDRSNTDPSNWKLISRGVLGRISKGNGYKKRPGYDEASPELKPAIMALAQLEEKVSEIRKVVDHDK